MGKYGLSLRANSQKFLLVVFVRIKPRVLARWTARLDLPTLGAPDITTTDSASLPSSKGYQSADVTLPASSSTVVTWLCSASKGLSKFPASCCGRSCHKWTPLVRKRQCGRPFLCLCAQVASKLEAYPNTCRLDESIKVAASL